ncbi:unnamed protein product [Closterium sp. NIES-54]
MAWVNQVTQNFTLPEIPQQNGIAESRNHTMAQITHCLLNHSNAPLSLWWYALYHVALLYNLYPHPHLPDTTPTALWLGKTPIARPLRADFDAPSEPPPAPAPSPPASPAIAPSPSEVSDPTSPVSSAAAPPSPPLPTAPLPPSAPITYHRRSNLSAPPPPPVPSSTQEPSLPQPSKLITYQRRRIPPPKPPKLSPPGMPAPPSSPVAHGTRSHGAAPPLALAIRCSVITPTPPAGGDVPSTLLEDKHKELCDRHAVIPQLSHIFPDIT